MRPTRVIAENLPRTSGRAALVGAGVIFAITTAAISCSVDLEEGLAVSLTSAQVNVTGTGASAAIAVDVGLSARVGEHAPASHTFIVPRADLFVGDSVAATINLDRPTGFDGSLDPGEERSYTLRGQTLPGAFNTGTLCATPTPTVRVLVYYQEGSAMEMGTAEGTTMRVTCTP